MRSRFPVALAVLLLAPAGCTQPSPKAAPAEQAPARPVITCDEPTFDLGVVAEGQEASHVFKIRNQGGQPLKIIKTEAG